MGINLGGAIGPIVTGYLAQSAAFSQVLFVPALIRAAAGALDSERPAWGMLIGLGLYLSLRDRYLPGIGLPPSPAGARRRLH